jgi:hypothetical protein
LFGQKKHKNHKNKSFDFLLEQTFARASSSKTFARALSLIKSEIVNHFQKVVSPQRTIYNAINRLQNEESIKDKKQTGRPTSWTSARKNQLKRLINNPKGVSQRRLGHKLSVAHVTFCRQLSKMDIP